MAEKPQILASANNGTVTVACKIPQGMELRLFVMRDIEEMVIGGGVRKTKIAEERNERVRINGNSVSKKDGPRFRMVGDYALTADVPKDFWDAWLDQNKMSDMVKNQLIFAYPTPDSTRDAAKERAKVKSGLERLDPDNLPKGLQRRPITANAGVEV